MEMRDKLSLHLKQIGDEKKRIHEKNKYSLSNISIEDLAKMRELQKLAKLYFYQIKALNFVLYEDDEILKCERLIDSEIVSEFIIK